VGPARDPGQRLPSLPSVSVLSLRAVLRALACARACLCALVCVRFFVLALSCALRGLLSSLSSRLLLRSGPGPGYAQPHRRLETRGAPGSARVFLAAEDTENRRSAPRHPDAQRSQPTQSLAEGDARWVDTGGEPPARDRSPRDRHRGRSAAPRPATSRAHPNCSAAVKAPAS